MHRKSVALSGLKIFSYDMISKGISWEISREVKYSDGLSKEWSLPEVLGWSLTRLSWSGLEDEENCV